MGLETFLNHKAHHLHLRHRNSMAEKPNHQVMEYEDLSDVMKTSSHHMMRKVKSERLARDEDVDKEAENFINLKHRKFSNCV